MNITFWSQKEGTIMVCRRGKYYELPTAIDLNSVYARRHSQDKQSELTQFSTDNSRLYEFRDRDFYRFGKQLEQFV